MSNNESPDHIYYDIIIPNPYPPLSTLKNDPYSYPTQPGQLSTLPPDDVNGLPEPNFLEMKAINAEYRDTLTQPIVEKADDYCMSIVRFAIPSTIPLFIFPNTKGDPQSPDIPVQKNLFSVCLEYTDINDETHSYMQWLTWTPEYLGFMPKDDIYWYMNTYQHLVDMINSALYQAFYNLYTDLSTLGGGYPAGLPTTPPFMTYNPANGLFTMNAEKAYNTRQSGNNINVYFNTLLFNFFATLPFIYDNLASDYSIIETNNAPPPYTYKTLNLGRNVRLDFRNLGNGNTEVLSSTYTLPAYEYKNSGGTVVWSSYSLSSGGGQALYHMTQEFSSQDRISSVRSIAFLSYSLPVVPNFVRNLTTALSGIPTVQTFLTDIDVVVEKGQDITSTIYYQPTGEYRYVNFQSNRPINLVDIKAVWVDKDGNYHDIYVFPGNNISIKLLFKKRGMMIDK